MRVPERTAVTTRKPFARIVSLGVGSVCGIAPTRGISALEGTGDCGPQPEPDEIDRVRATDYEAFGLTT